MAWRVLSTARMVGLLCSMGSRYRRFCLGTDDVERLQYTTHRTHHCPV